MIPLNNSRYPYQHSVSSAYAAFICTRTSALRCLIEYTGNMVIIFIIYKMIYAHIILGVIIISEHLIARIVHPYIDIWGINCCQCYSFRNIIENVLSVQILVLCIPGCLKRPSHRYYHDNYDCHDYDCKKRICLAYNLIRFSCDKLHINN